jgi:hypothetical protein
VRGCSFASPSGPLLLDHRSLAAAHHAHAFAIEAQRNGVPGPLM